MSFSIEEIYAREILDSRGNPTVEVECMLDGGAPGRAAVPSGASTGEHEALELRDGDKKRYLGKGVLEGGRERRTPRSRTALVGLDARDQAGRSTRRCSSSTARRTRAKLGANAILGVSLAVARAAADRPACRSTATSAASGAHAAAGAADEHHQRRRARRQQRSTSRSS